MLLFSRQVGRRVLTCDGVVVGRVRDLVVRLGASSPQVTRLVVDRGARRGMTVSCVDVVAFEADGVRLGRRWTAPAIDETRRRPGVHDDLLPDELLLGRDVLDTQVVDLVGHRSGRVCDVLLSPLPEGGLEVAGVDVGTAALCRRLGLAGIDHVFSDRVVAWPDLHLRSGRGHAVQLATPASAVHRLDAPGLAELLTHLNVQEGTKVVRAIRRQRAAEVVARTDPELAGKLLRALPADVANDVVASLPTGHERQHYQSLLVSPAPIGGRRFLRTRGWRRHLPTGTHAQPRDDRRG
jgi:hypothetical protein